MSQRNSYDHEVHPLIAERWSPRSFSERTIDESQLASVLEAARWAPSCFNEQPWRFIVALRQDPAEFQRLLSCLVDENQAWAKRAAALMVTVTSSSFSLNGNPNPHAWHDVGLAIGQLTLQAGSMGLHVHQMAGFKSQQARELYGIPEGFEAVTAVAIGYQGDAAQLPESLRGMETGPRNRRPHSQLVVRGMWRPDNG
jgi:nitroreductase